MAITRQEIPHHTPEQIRDYLTDAAAMVDELDLPVTLTEAAFGKAVDLLAAKQLIFQETGGIPNLDHIRNGRRI